MSQPIPIMIFKNRGAMQVSFSPASKDDNGYDKPGGVFIRMMDSDGSGGKKYNWDSGTSIFLAANELGLLLSFFKNRKGTIYHDPDKGKANEGTRSKSLNISEGQNGTLFVNMNVKDKKHSVSLTPGEIIQLEVMIGTALSKAYNWA